MSETTKEITAEEVAKHNKKDDIWIIVHGKGANPYTLWLRFHADF